MLLFLFLCVCVFKNWNNIMQYKMLTKIERKRIFVFAFFKIRTWKFCGVPTFLRDFREKKNEMCFWRLEYYFEILPFHLMKTQERINCITFLLISFLWDLSLARSTWFNCCQNLVKQEKQKRTKTRKTSNYLFLSLMTIRSVTQMTLKILEFAFGTITRLGIWRN